jgi:hypothetical protein
MGRNWGIPSVTSGIASGGNHDPALRRADTLRDSNSLARHLPPGLAEPNLTVIRGGSFFHHHPRNPVQELDAVFDHREFAAWFFVIAFGISVGFLLAVAAALLDWS